MVDRVPHVKPKGKPCSHNLYRINCEQYEHLRAEADDRCRLCRRTGSQTAHGFLVIDHDAAVGIWAVRGLLCSDCNSHRVPYGNQGTDQGLREYLADPWYLRILADQGFDVRIPPEPAVGTQVTWGRRRWLRKRDGWHAQDRMPGGESTWRQMHRRYGPHELTVHPSEATRAELEAGGLNP